MFIEQIYTGCLSEAAYYIESEGEAAIIDPIRETAPYLQMAEERGAKIKYIFETHFHADFVSGHLDLARKTGATIIYGPEARPQYEVHIAQDGEEFALGKISFKVLHTPGHTLESSCYLLHNEAGVPHAIFSGDTLFVGAVGRPDLAVKSERPLTKEELASMMYDSLQSKIMPLADEVLVYPAHGAGSSCGKGIGKETWSTIGVQKKTNYALQPMSREAFVKEVTDGLLPPPPYFFRDAAINMEGYDNLENVLDRNLTGLSPDEVALQRSANAVLLDTRHPDQFEKASVPGSVNIGLNGSYAVWAGTLLSMESPLVIIAEEGKEQESITRLARVGYENVLGYLKGGIEAWVADGKESQSIHSLTPAEFKEKAGAASNILDVRKPSEFQNGHVVQAQNLPLSQIEARIAELDANKEYMIHCAGGYRSMIAASLLAKHGIKRISNVYGGYKAIKEAGTPVAEPEVV